MVVPGTKRGMRPGGQLRVTTGGEGNTARIVIADSGQGIPPDALPHIFDPFFSTKGTEGTGLGLSVSYGIVKNHKGRLRVESTVGVGTTCFIELPAISPTEDSHDGGKLKGLFDFGHHKRNELSRRGLFDKSKWR